MRDTFQITVMGDGTELRGYLTGSLKTLEAFADDIAPYGVVMARIHQDNVTVTKGGNSNEHQKSRYERSS